MRLILAIQVGALVAAARSMQQCGRVQGRYHSSAPSMQLAHSHLLLIYAGINDALISETRSYPSVMDNYRTAWLPPLEKYVFEICSLGPLPAPIPPSPIINIQKGDALTGNVWCPQQQRMRLRTMGTQQTRAKAAPGFKSCSQLPLARKRT